MEQPQPPIKLANFTLYEVIGRGGMGVVWRGEQINPRRPVAVKVVAPDPGLSPPMIEHLKLEGDTAARFEHPNLAHVYECGIVDEHYYLAMQYLPGGDLSARIGDGMPPEAALAVLRPLLEALGHVHERGFVHRDIKPSNVLFNGAGQPVLVDFGIAKSVGEETAMTAAGWSTGTPSYMSPEQIQGLPLDARTDLYALGILLYEMLTGAPPHASGTPEEIRLAHLRESVPPLPDGLARLQPLLDGLLARDPEDRLPSSDAVAQALDEESGPIRTAVSGATAALKRSSDDSGTDATTSVATAMAQPVQFPARLHRPRVPVLATIAILVLLAAVYGLSRFSGPQPSDAPTVAATVRPGVAVLPLTRRSDWGRDEQFVDGFHDELLTQLSRLGGLRVISRNSVLRYRDSDLPLADIASALDVETILEGSMQRAGQQVRITVNLINAERDELMWAETYDRALSVENLFAIQSGIAQAVAAALSAELTAEEVDQLGSRRTTQLAAYEAYLLAREAFARRIGGSTAALDQAREHFERALALEPDYAEALAGLAAVHAVYPGYVDTTRNYNALDLARAYARRAIAIDARLSLPHAVLGRLAGDAFERVERLRRAIALEPSSSTAHLWLALEFGIAGDLMEGERYLAKARELDPFSPLVALYQATFAELRGDRERALAFLLAERERALIPLLGTLSYIRFVEGDTESSAALLRPVLPAREYDAWLVGVFPQEGRPISREKAVATVLGPPDVRGYWELQVLFLAALGANEEALALIDERQSHSSSILVYLWNSAAPELRRGPLFEAMVERAGLPAWWAVHGYPSGCAADDSSPAGYRCRP